MNSNFSDNVPILRRRCLRVINPGAKDTGNQTRDNLTLMPRSNQPTCAEIRQSSLQSSKKPKECEAASPKSPGYLSRLDQGIKDSPNLPFELQSNQNSPSLSTERKRPLVSCTVAQISLNKFPHDSSSEPATAVVTSNSRCQINMKRRQQK